MKRLFTIALMLTSLVFASCDREEKEQPTPIFTLETTSVTASYEGGRMAVGYTITNPAEWAQIRVNTSANWISNFDWTTTDGQILFDVAPNTGYQRIDTIKVEFAFQIYPIVVTQGEHIEVYDTPNLYAYSYGNGNYSILLGDSDYINSASLKPNAQYFFFDLFADPATVPTDRDCFDIPRGTYTFDPDNTEAPGTIGGGEYTTYMWTDAQRIYQAEISDCTMVVTDTALIVDLNIKYDGAYRVIYNKAPHYHKTNSTITSAINESFGDSTIAGAIYYGEYYDYDYPGAKTNYEIQILDTEKLIMLDLDLISDQELPYGEIPTGNFDIVLPERFADFSGQVAMPGAFYGDKFYPSFFAYTTEDNMIKDIVLINRGTVSIVKNGSEKYTFIVDGFNDTHDGEPVVLSWTGTISQWRDDSTSSFNAPARVVSKSKIFDFSQATIKAERESFRYTPRWER